ALILIRANPCDPWSHRIFEPRISRMARMERLAGSRRDGVFRLACRGGSRLRSRWRPRERFRRADAGREALKQAFEIRQIPPSTRPEEFLNDGSILTVRVRAGT